MKTTEISRSAVAVVESRDGRYLLEVRPNLPGKLACAGKLALFGGGVERNESPSGGLRRELFNEELVFPDGSRNLESLRHVWQGMVWGPSGRPKEVSLFVARVNCRAEEVRLHPDLVASGTGIMSYPLGVYPPPASTTTFTMRAVDAHFHGDYAIQPVMVLYGTPSTSAA